MGDNQPVPKPLPIPITEAEVAILVGQYIDYHNHYMGEQFPKGMPFVLTTEIGVGAEFYAIGMIVGVEREANISIVRDVIADSEPGSERERTALEILMKIRDRGQNPSREQFRAGQPSIAEQVALWYGDPEYPIAVAFVDGSKIRIERDGMRAWLVLARTPVIHIPSVLPEEHNEETS